MINSETESSPVITQTSASRYDEIVGVTIIRKTIFFFESHHYAALIILCAMSHGPCVSCDMLHISSNLNHVIRFMSNISHSMHDVPYIKIQI